MFAENLTYVSNAKYDGNEVTVFDEDNQDDVMNVFAYGTQPFPDGTGLLWGVYVDAERGNYYACWHLDGDGKPTKIDVLENENIIDIYFHRETEEIVYLLRDDTGNNFNARILLADMETPRETIEISQYISDVSPTSIAFWQNKMFLGMDNCQIYRSANPPYAQFTVTPKTGKVWETIFYVDASSSSDEKDPAAVLKVRWQWDSDGKFTEWTTTKKAQHKYPSAGTKFITLEVKDLDGEMSSTTREVVVSE
jgi:PKD repeat protein